MYVRLADVALSYGLHRKSVSFRDACVTVGVAHSAELSARPELVADG
jgi:hypothetical protein